MVTILDVMKKLLITFLWLLYFLEARAQENLPFVKYQVENGLSHNTVRCIMQDSYDFMWFGTSDGLNCFNGKTFKIYKNKGKDKRSIGANFISSLFEDSNRNIWVGGNKGLFLFDRGSESFSGFDLKTQDGVSISSNVSDIIQSASGKIWIATLGQGIFIYDPKDQSLVQNSVYTPFVVKLLNIPSGDVAATSRQEGIIRFTQDGKYVRSYLPADRTNDLSGVETNSLCLLNDALYFSMGADGFYAMNLKTGQITPAIKENSAIKVSNIRVIFPVSTNELWLGGDNGLYLFHASTRVLRRLDDPTNDESLSDQSVYDIERDREGGMWIATYFGGVNYAPKNIKPFERYSPATQGGEISGKAISQFVEDKEGNIWIGTEDGGLNYFNSKTKQVTAYKPGGKENSLSYHNIRALLLDNDKLWVSVFSRGIDVLDLKTKKVKNYRHSRYDQNSVCNNNINVLYKDSRGTIFVGADWGLSRYHRDSDSFSLVKEIGPSIHIFDILEDRLGLIWFATYNAGVFCFNPVSNGWRHFMHNADDERSLCGNSVITLFEDHENTIWLGTEGNGLCSYDRDTDAFIPFDPEEKLLPNQVIKAIEQDNSGNLWIATNAGLVQVSLDSAYRRIFTKADGLQSNQFNFKSSLKAHDGKLYFGGINGFNAFYPKDFSENEFIPKVVISEFRLFNKTVKVGDKDSPLIAPVYDQKEIVLRHDQNAFSFMFVALSYQAPDKNKYVYFMDGVDIGWNDANDGNNTAYYTNLHPGEYVFRVRGSNNDGIWNQNEAVVTIRISPPFWKTGWAYAFYFVTLTGPLALYYRGRVKRQAHDHRERLRAFQEKQEKENYLSKINFFTNLAHEIRTPLTLIKLPLERIIDSADGNERTKGYLTTIEKNTAYLLNLINQLLDFRKTEEVEFTLHIKNHNITEALQDIHTRFKVSAEIQNIDFTIDLPAGSLISAVDADAFNKVVSNLLSNALKFASSKINLALEVSEAFFEVRISDNGAWIQKEEQEKIFEAFYQSDNRRFGTGIGLAFAKTLVEKHKGTLVHENNDWGGSSFIISLPRFKSGEPESIISGGKAALLKAPGDFELLTETGFEKPESQVKLLLVEDNPELLHLVADFLKNSYQVYSAFHGKEALALLAEHDFDIVVSDLMMPEMDGYELCKTMKSDTRFCHIPFIILTAKTTMEAKLMGLDLGSDAYLEKPFSMEHLCKQVDNLLKSRRQLRELFAASPLLSSVEIAVTERDKKFTERLNAKIEQHIAEENLPIDTLAEHMNMSRSNFYRKVKSMSGMSPNDYLKVIRLKKAAELLLKQEYRINEVYEQTGFNSSSYFAKCFKDQFGLLPREFLQKAKDEISPETTPPNNNISEGLR